MQIAIRPLAALLFALTVLGCNGQVQLSPEAKGLLQDGKDAYRRGDDEAVVARMGAFLNQYADSSPADQAYYYRGRAKYRLGNLEGAEADMAEALARTTDSGLRASAMIVLGDAAYDTEKMALAEQRYLLALRDVPRGGRDGQYAMFRLGCAMQRQGKWAEADRRFDRLIYVFPKSPLAAPSKQKVRSVAWTVRVGVYRKRADAERSAAKLRARKSAAAVRPVRRDGQLLFVVQVGRYQTYEEAAGALENVRGLQPDAFITVTR